MKLVKAHILHKGIEVAKCIWRRGLTHASLPSIVFAVALVVAAALTRHLLGLVDPRTIVFLPYFLAVLGATLFGGLLPGLVALILSGLSAWWSFLPPAHAFFPVTHHDATSLLIYYAIGAIFVVAAERHRKLLRQYHEQDHFSQLIISELRHRLRNKLATAQAVLTFHLRAGDALRDEIAGRLSAIERTDEFIFLNQNKSVEISQIVESEFRPYGGHSRIKVTGDSVLLPPTLALPLTLIIHELLTNAAKYGPLSHHLGRIDVTWTADDARVQIIWRESGGLPIPGPHHRGSGSELFQRALAPFRGTVDLEFAPDGLKCTIFFVLPRESRAASAFDRQSIAPL